MVLELYPGEELVTTTRPHARTLFWPIIGLFSISALVGAGIAVIPMEYRPLGQQAVAAVGAMTAIFAVLRPVLRRSVTSVTLTTQRLIVRTGLVRRAEHQVPLNRLVDVASSRAVADFGFGSGTLLLTTIGGQRLRLTHMPKVKAMRQAISELAAETWPELPAGPGQWQADGGWAPPAQLLSPQQWPPPAQWNDPTQQLPPDRSSTADPWPHTRVLDEPDPWPHTKVLDEPDPWPRTRVLDEPDPWPHTKVLEGPDQWR